MSNDLDYTGMYAWSERTSGLFDLAERLAAYVHHLDMAPSGSPLSTRLATGLRELGAVDAEKDVPGVARAPWSVFITRHLGIEELSLHNLESTCHRLQLQNEVQSTEVADLLREIEPYSRSGARWRLERSSLQLFQLIELNPCP